MFLHMGGVQRSAFSVQRWLFIVVGIEAIGKKILHAIISLIMVIIVDIKKVN